MAHRSLLCYHRLCSMLGAVERDFVASFDVHPEHRVTYDNEHEPELGCSNSVYALIRDRRKTMVLILLVYLSY